MIRPLIFFVCTFLFSCKADHKHQIPNRPPLKILAAGKPGIDFDVLNLITQKYGVIYKLVGGCTETNEFMDSIDKLNQKTYAILSKEFGENWSKELDNEVDSISRLIRKTEKIIKVRTDYDVQKEKLEDNHKIVGLWVEPTEKEYIFLAQACIYSGFGQTSTRNVYKQWNVDIWNWKIIDSSITTANIGIVNSGAGH
jgi:hypothetical protein